MTPELIKLIAILCLGLIAIGGGLVFQIKVINPRKQKAQENNNNNTYSNPNLETSEISNEENSAKEYISTYKTEYSIEAIKTGLMNMGISDSTAQEYIRKYS